MISEGSTIGSYRITKLLGQGGMGAVYVGEHNLLGRAAAIKVLLPSLSAHEEVVQRFFNEARAVTQIADPGIVQVFDFGHDARGRAYIVMELLEGETVGERLERVGTLAPLETVRLVRMAAMSLQAAHARGIVHRDLKPANIFIVADPAVLGGERAKLLDFGIAKLSNDDTTAGRTSTGAVIGTPLYMSPEQCRGAGGVDHRSDIYALACVMMTMLTGAPPFPLAGSGELIIAHVQDTAPLAASRVAGLPAVLDDILQRCLAKDPGERFQSMAELADALGRIDEQLAGMRLAPSPLATLEVLRPPGPPTTLTAAASSQQRPPAARTRWPVIAAVAGLAVTGGVAIALWTSRGGDPPAAAPPPVADRPITMPVTPPPDAQVAAAPPADAMTVDAAAIVAVPIDAATPAKHRDPGRKHGPKTSPNTPTAADVDRGD